MPTFVTVLEKCCAPVRRAWNRWRRSYCATDLTVRDYSRVPVRPRHRAEDDLKSRHSRFPLRCATCARDYVGVPAGLARLRQLPVRSPGSRVVRTRSCCRSRPARKAPGMTETPEPTVLVRHPDGVAVSIVSRA